MPSFYCSAAIAIKSLVLFTFVGTRALLAAVFLSLGLIALVLRCVARGCKVHAMHLDQRSVSFVAKAGGKKATETKASTKIVSGSEPNSFDFLFIFF